MVMMRLMKARGNRYQSKNSVGLVNYWLAIFHSGLRMETVGEVKFTSGQVAHQPEPISVSVA